MIRKRYVIVALAIVSILLGSFLVNNLILAQSGGEYDPWLDLNDDGVIDVNDLQVLALIYGTSGEQITKASLIYDSGWINITDKAGQYFTITHNLSLNMTSPEVIVDITGKTALDSVALQRYLGKADYGPRWNRTYGGGADDLAHSVVQAVDGGYAIAGSTNSFGAGSLDVYLVKTDSAGNMLWNRTYGGTKDDAAYSVVQTSDGGYAIVGYTDSFGAGGFDFWLVRYIYDGDLGLAWADSTADTLIFYRGATDYFWNYMHVRIWKNKETP